MQYRICKRCIMDTTDPDIIFDDQGNCNHCTDFFNNLHVHQYKGNQTDHKLEQVIRDVKYKGRNSKYDCLIGLSGGVDSSYVSYLAAEIGLKPLLVHFDNGWDSELAIHNIENIVKHLGFDYHTYVVDWQEFRDIQVAFLKASVLDMETPTDHAFLGALYKVANDYGIKHILTGSNFATEGILPKSWGYNSKDIKQLKAIYNKFGTGSFNTFPLLGLTREMFYTFIRGIKLVRILRYVPYSKTEAIQILQKKLDWVYYGGKHYESVFTKFTQSYILPIKFNVDKRKAHLSTLICNGEISREKAMQILNKEPYSPLELQQEKEYVCKKLGLTEKEFDEILEMPVRTYKDYPNSERFLSFIYSIYNSLKR